MAKILIVEDDVIIQSAYRMVLGLEGHDVRAAPDGVEGLRLAEEFEPDLVLLDMLMPNMNGLEFLRAYNLKLAHPDVKVIVFSNIAVPDDIEGALELGASRYLTKSEFTPKQMVAIIKQELET